MFSLGLNYYNNPNIIYKGFSDKTLKYGNDCIKELRNSGISVYDSLCYLINKEGLFYLYSGSSELGFLTNENDETDISFKKFVNSAYSDIGSFYCIAFPCYIEWYPFSNKYIAFKTRDSFEDIKESISSYGC
ncbi:hypothetical protein ACEE21_15380 [Clostridium baratii]